MNKTTISKDVFIDFGVRKPHFVLVGQARRPRRISDLRELRLSKCRVYLEEGCPWQGLNILLERNHVFMVEGQRVKRMREAAGLAKTDAHDVFAIRDLAQTQPDAFRVVTRQEKEEVQNRMSYAYYCKITELIVSLKNRQTAFSRQFGIELPRFNLLLENLENEKEHSSILFAKFENHLKKLRIRGVGPRYLGGILIKAPPRRFRSLSRYLSYCGLKASVIESRRYSHHVRSLFHQLATSVVVHKDARFYPLYRRIKRDLKSRFPDYRKSRIDAMARNRVATFLAKEIYFHFREEDS